MIGAIEILSILLKSRFQSKHLGTFYPLQLDPSPPVESAARSSHCGAAETNLTRNHEVASLISGLAQWVKGSGVAVSCGRRCGSDAALLWLWHRPAASAPI